MARNGSRKKRRERAARVKKQHDGIVRRNAQIRQIREIGRKALLLERLKEEVARGT